MYNRCGIKAVAVVHLNMQSCSHKVDEPSQRRDQDFSLGTRPKAGVGFLGEGGRTASSPARGYGEHCELPRLGLGWSPDRPKVFHYFQHSGWPLLTL